MDLRQWVNDSILRLQGFTEDTVVDYIIASAKKSKSAAKLQSALEKNVGIASNPGTEAFVKELYEKFPRKGQTNSQKEETLKLLAKNRSFTMIDEPKERKPKKPKIINEMQVIAKGERKFRKQDSESKAQAWEILDAPEDEFSEPEAELSERERDLQERDELDERIRARAEKPIETKRVEAVKKEHIPSLRERSRQEYLKNRERQKLIELRKEIEDEERMFGNERRTKKEIRELERKKMALQIATEMDENRGGWEGYHMPEDYLTEKGKIDNKKKEAALFQRYDKRDQKSVVTDQQDWEDSRISKTLARPGAKDKKYVPEKEYDFVFEDEHRIKFIVQKDFSTPEILNQPSPAELKAKSIQDLRKSLPIYSYREEFLNALEAHQTLIIVGETGSGKTTQIPQYLVEAGYCKNGLKIACTQPRRVAAMSVATRVAEEMNVTLGREVGYSIRFEDCTSEKTIVKYMTDGMLLREFLTEPDLGAYSCLMIDEAHERTLQTDILFGLVKDIARFRPDLKLLISSATMDAEKFSEYFDDAPIFNIPGRKYPVDIYHTEAPEANYIDAAINQIMTIHVTQDPGDILLFLSGQHEIEMVQERLLEICRAFGTKLSEMIICPIYANLPSDMQAKIFEPTPEGARKVVLSTNIAETSLTIDGVKYVIDPGFCKQNNYNPKSGMESLVTVPISRASAKQRAGRAGRVGPGKCFRLFTEWAYQNECEENTIPEIQRSNMASTVLLLKSLGINDLMNFDFLDAPAPETLMRALELLYALGALNDRGELTKLGRRMAEFPIEPMLSKSLIAAEKYQCTEEVVSIVAMLSIGNAIFYSPKEKKVHAEQARKNFFRPGGDHLSLLAVWEGWAETDYSTQWCYENFIQYRSMKKARSIREQLLNLMERTEIPLVSNPDPTNTIPIRKAITSGFFYNAARMKRTGDAYSTVKTSQTVLIHPSSSLHSQNPPMVVYFELVLTTKEFMRQCLEIQPQWLTEVAPHYFRPKEIEIDIQKKLPKKSGRTFN